MNESASVLEKVAAAAKAEKPLERAPDSFTTIEFAKHIGVGKHGAQRRLNALAEQGQIRRIKMNVKNAVGVVQPVSGWQYVEQSQSASKGKKGNGVK